MNSTPPLPIPLGSNKEARPYRSRSLSYKIMVTAAVLFTLYYCRCCAVCLTGFVTQWEKDYFGTDVWLELMRPCPFTERLALQPLMSEIDLALSSTGYDYDERKEKFGSYLSSFAYYTSDTVSEKHILRFLTGKIYGNKAYIWIEYKNQGYDSNGKPTNSSGGIIGPIRVRLTAEWQDGKWVVTDHKEHP